MRIFVTFCASILLVLFSCERSVKEVYLNDADDELTRIQEVDAYLNLPTSPYTYKAVFPDYMKQIGLTPMPINSAKASLGRVLFYDKNLSQDRTVSCASCHKQEKAFADDVAFSRGVNGKNGKRNSLAIGNTAQFGSHYESFKGFTPNLLWDGRAQNIPNQSTLAFTNPDEMNISLDEVMERIKEKTYYKHLWKDVYGHSDMQQSEMLEAIESFVNSIGTYNSKLDQIITHAKATDITVNDTIICGVPTISDLSVLLGPKLDLGRSLFVDHCSNCHAPIRSAQDIFEACNGLDQYYTDSGKYAITGNPAHKGVFKTTSLRNIELTGPYMHDGRFATLEEVVNFYSTGVKNHPNRHPKVVNRNYTAAEKEALVAFLKSMTDKSIATDKRYSNPFK